MMSLFFAVLVWLIALLGLSNSALADREGIPGRRVGGGTRWFFVERISTIVEQAKKPPVKKNPGGRVPGGTR